MAHIWRTVSPAGLFLCGPEHHVGKALAGLLVCLPDDVGIDVGGGAHLRVAQALGDGHHVLPLADQDGSHCVPERMGVDVGKVVPHGELA